MKKYFTWHDQVMKYKYKIPCIILCIRNPYFLFHTLTRVIQRVPLVQELFNRGYELVSYLNTGNTTSATSSTGTLYQRVWVSLCFSMVRFAQSLGFSWVFSPPLLVFTTFSIGHCHAVLLQFTAFDYSFGIINSF